MKRKIAVLLLLAFCVLFLWGCRQNEEIEKNLKKEYPKGWLDDTEALTVKLTGQTEYIVHSFLGDPQAHILGVESDVYLDSEGVAVYIYYNEKGYVNNVISELPYSVTGTNVSAQKRCEIMDKIIGNTKNQIEEDFGKPNAVFKKENKWEYNEFLEEKVLIYFDENQIAQKVYVSD